VPVVTIDDDDLHRIALGGVQTIRGEGRLSPPTMTMQPIHGSIHPSGRCAIRSFVRVCAPDAEVSDGAQAGSSTAGPPVLGEHSFAEDESSLERAADGTGRGDPFQALGLIWAQAVRQMNRHIDTPRVTSAS
jgi:hypothetical protein